MNPRGSPPTAAAPSGTVQRLRAAARGIPAVVWLSTALALAAALRVAVLTTLDVQQASDALWYLERARELVATGRYAENGVPTAFWPVGYPAFLAALMAVFGTEARVGQIANAVLGVLAVLLVYRFALQQFGSQRVGGVAALLLALYPNHLGYTVGLYSEPLYSVLLLALVVVTRLSSRWGVWRWLLAGLLAGAATLVKSQTLLLAPLLLALLALPSWPWKSRLPRGQPRLRLTWSLDWFLAWLLPWLLAMAAMTAVVAPWTWRNHVVMGAAVPVSTNAGMSLLIANNEAMHWGQRMDYDLSDAVFKELRFSVADQVAADQRARAMAWQWMQDNPGRFVSLMPWKVYRQWAYDGESEWLFQLGYARYEEAWVLFRTVRGLNQIYYLVLLVVGLWGLRRALQVPGGRSPAAWAVPLMLLYFTALCTVFSGQARYHYPLMPFVFAYAAWWLMAKRPLALPRTCSSPIK